MVLPWCLTWIWDDTCRQVGQAVLGSLKPKVLVVTTPNREYNPVLQHLGNSLIPPNNTRNSDHRFEWYPPLPPLSLLTMAKPGAYSWSALACSRLDVFSRPDVLCLKEQPGTHSAAGCRRTRAEFQTWAEELASTHSYAVAFDGIGRALEEQKALQDPSWPAGITDIGTATQVLPSLLLHFLLLCSTSVRM